jgi:uncharacterized protein DUF4154
MAVMRGYLAVLAGVAFALASPATVRAEGAASEYDVKAAFLYNFTKFVEWPPSAFQSDRSPLRLCVLGDDPFGESLRALAGEELAGRKLFVLGAGSMADPAGCQILFVSRSESGRLREILAAVRGDPVLTVGDTKGFLEQGGIINFIREGSKVRFEINHQSAEQAGIKISSKLLRLATRVVGGPGARPGP